MGTVVQCVRVLSVEGWKPWSTGIPTQRLVTRPATSLPVGIGLTARRTYPKRSSAGGCPEGN